MSKPWAKEEENKLKKLTGLYSFKKMSGFFEDRTPIALQKKSIKMGLISNFKPKIHSKNEDFWEKPNLINSYFAGFITADGCINKNSIIINIHPRDIEILEILKKYTEFTGKIRVYERPIYQDENRNHSVCYINFSSVKKWKKDLKNNFGIINQKTFRMLPPNLNRELSLAFLIGLIDGDGSIGFSTKASIRIYSSNYEILQWAVNLINSFNLQSQKSNFKKKDTVTIRKGKTCYEIGVWGQKAVDLFAILKDIPVPKLMRKWSHPEFLKRIDNQSPRISVKDTLIKEITLKEATPFIETWHYSKKIPTGKNIFLGWYVNEELYAVADYGIGVNAYQSSFLKRITTENVTNNNLLELKRLCRKEPKNDNLPLTAFLSRCHKFLKQRGYKYIVSFSDPEHNHNGGIYKAANFKHLGLTNAEMHTIDKNGIKRHRRYYYRYAKSHNCSMKEAREILGLTPIKTKPKDRWFIII